MGLLTRIPASAEAKAKILRIPSLPELHRKTLSRKSSVRQVLCPSVLANLTYCDQYLVKCSKSGSFGGNGTGNLT